jgi:hypothetical protein
LAILLCSTFRPIHFFSILSRELILLPANELTFSLSS